MERMAVRDIKMNDYHQAISDRDGWWSPVQTINGYNFRIWILCVKGHVIGNVWFVPGEYQNLQWPVTLNLGGEIQDRQNLRKIHCCCNINFPMKSRPNEEVPHHAAFFVIAKSALDTAVGEDNTLYIQVNHLNIQIHKEWQDVQPRDGGQDVQPCATF